MSNAMLGGGAGAAEGLETLFNRLLREDVAGESKRHNMAGEDLGNKQLEETSALRRATQDYTEQERGRANEAKMRDDVLARVKVRPTGEGNVTQQEYDQETKYGAPTGLYNKHEVTQFPNDFMGPVDPEKGPQRGESTSVIDFLGTGDQQAAKERADMQAELAAIRNNQAQEREDRLRSWGPPVVPVNDPSIPGNTKYATRGEAPGMTAPLPSGEKQKLDAYKTTLQMIKDIEQGGYNDKDYNDALGLFDANVGATARQYLPKEIAGNMAGGAKGEQLRNRISRLKAQASFQEGGKQFTGTEADLLNTFLSQIEQQPATALGRLSEFKRAAAISLRQMGVSQEEIDGLTGGTPVSPAGSGGGGNANPSAGAASATAAPGKPRVRKVR